MVCYDRWRRLLHAWHRTAFDKGKSSVVVVESGG